MHMGGYRKTTTQECVRWVTYSAVLKVVLLLRLVVGVIVLLLSNLDP